MLHYTPLLCLLLVLLAGIGQGCRSDSCNGFDADQALKVASDTPISLNSTWAKFYFTNANSRGFPTYVVNITSGGKTLQIVDYFCGGDQFRFQIALATIIDTSVPVDPPSCSNYQATPDGALAMPSAFSQASQLFPVAGFFIITIVAMVSPYSAGAAAIRLI